MEAIHALVSKALRGSEASGEPGPESDTYAQYGYSETTGEDSGNEVNIPCMGIRSYCMQARTRSDHPPCDACEP